MKIKVKSFSLSEFTIIRIEQEAKKRDRSLSKTVDQLLNEALDSSKINPK